MSKEPRVLFVVNSLSGGGAEKSSRQVFNELLKLGLDVHLIALNKTTEEKTLKDSHETVLERNWKDGIGLTLKNYLFFLKKVSQFRPSIIVAHCELPELYVALIPIIRTKIVVVEHTSIPWNGRKPLGRLIRSLLRLRQAIWVSVNVAGSSIWFGSKAPKVILNPVSRSVNDSQPKIEERFVFIGRLRKEKRPEMAIEAVISQGQAIGLIGDGELAEKLRFEYSSDSESVQFYGFVDNPWQILGEEALIIMPSEYEGDGLVAVEAIINGFPILLADNRDLRRFNLPSKHYFATLDDLKTKISLALIEGNSYFAPPLVKQREIEKERDLEEIALEWLNLLSSLTR
jgi:glycosyltransferase involved in cell wall biosynthesis